MWPCGTPFLLCKFDSRFLLARRCAAFHPCAHPDASHCRVLLFVRFLILFVLFPCLSFVLLPLLVVVIFLLLLVEVIGADSILSAVMRWAPHSFPSVGRQATDPLSTRDGAAPGNTGTGSSVYTAAPEVNSREQPALTIQTVISASKPVIRSK